MLGIFNGLSSERFSLGINVIGLDNPPIGQKYRIGHREIEVCDILGGIFRMTPMRFMRYFRWDERLPMGMGEAKQFANFCESSNITLLRTRSVSATH